MIHIYTAPDPSAALSINGSFTNPLTFTFDGVNGGVQEKRLYLRNDDPDASYTDIHITPLDGDNLANNDGYSWKLMLGDQRPLSEQWDLVDNANEITVSGLADTTTYIPFWLRVEIPAGAPIASFQNTALQIIATE